MLGEFQTPNLITIVFTTDNNSSEISQFRAHDIRINSLSPYTLRPSIFKYSTTFPPSGGVFFPSFLWELSIEVFYYFFLNSWMNCNPVLFVASLYFHFLIVSSFFITMLFILVFLMFSKIVLS